MKECWSEGELRAYIDRELPAESMQRVAAHLEECSACGDLWAELAGRAHRVSALMDTLIEPKLAVVPQTMARHASRVWRWAAAGAALAAGIALGIAMLPKPAPKVAVIPPAAVQRDVDASSQVLPDTTANAVRLASAGPKSALPRRNAKPAARGNQTDAPFLALDDDPIESGVVWRVELGPREVPAEVIVDSDGRPRAIRLVNFKPNH
jgi:anti-sigma factor RsiW